jgi:hypothetical protein
MSFEAMYSQALMPNPGSPAPNSSRALARCAEFIFLYTLLPQMLPWPVCK